MSDDTEAATSGRPTQLDVWCWAVEKWPNRMTPEARALKLGEEAGEVLGAVVRLGEGRGSLDHAAQEMAQTVICVMALAESLDIDLDAAIAGEWAELAGREWFDQTRTSDSSGGTP